MGKVWGKEQEEINQRTYMYTCIIHGHRVEEAVEGKKRENERLEVSVILSTIT